MTAVFVGVNATFGAIALAIYGWHFTAVLISLLAAFSWTHAWTKGREAAATLKTLPE